MFPQAHRRAGIGLALMLPCVFACGDGRSYDHAPTLITDDRGDPVPETMTLVFSHGVTCVATLIAPDVALTCAECGRMARQWAAGLVAHRSAYARDVRQTYLIRQVALHPDAPGPTLPCERPIDRAKAPACDALAQACPANPTARPTPVKRDALLRCYARQPRALLEQLGLVGVPDGVDLAVLYLDNPVPDTPAATLSFNFPSEVEDGLERVGTIPAHNDGEWPRALQKYRLREPIAEVVDHGFVLGEMQTARFFDAGAAAFYYQKARIRGSSDVQVQRLLVGVASRPYLGLTQFSPLADELASEGVAFARVDAAMGWIDEALRRGCREGIRVACQDRVGARLPGAPAQGCAQTRGQGAIACLWAAWTWARCRRRRQGGAPQLGGLCIVVLAASLTQAACGTENMPPPMPLRGATHWVGQPIVSGAAAGIADYPETGAVLLGGQGLCSGTLIAPDVVLTAAHCVHTDLRYEFIRSTSFVDRTRKTTTLVRSVVVHEGYQPACARPQAGSPEEEACDEVAQRCEDANCLQNLPMDLLRRAGFFGLGAQHDVALLFLAAPVTDVPPSLPITAGELTVGARLRNVGFGQRSPTLSLRPPEAGDKYYADNDVAGLSDFEFRLGTQPPQGCWGDSGGPAFVISPSGERRIAGVASRLTESFDCTTGVTFSRVDAEWPWIASTMDSARANGLRVNPQGSILEPVQRQTPPPTMPEDCTATSPRGWMGLAALLAGARACRRRRARPAMGSLETTARRPN